jgi:hypothetical protein
MRPKASDGQYSVEAVRASLVGVDARMFRTISA